jgi:hypothetical protein
VAGRLAKKTAAAHASKYRFIPAEYHPSVAKRKPTVVSRRLRSLTY